MSTVFLDLESTGLERDRPRVTELEPRHISEEPRVVNKLVLCFNPEGAMFNDVALTYTGLNPDNLSAQPKFSASTVRLLDAFCVPGFFAVSRVSCVCISIVDI